MREFKYEITATEARKDWSRVIDNAVRDRPQLIKRTRDYVWLMSDEVLETLLSDVTYLALEIKESDGSVTANIDELDIVENAETKEALNCKLAAEILEYANQYYEEFSYWSSSPERKKHIAYVLQALILNDTQKIGEKIRWLDGKN